MCLNGCEMLCRKGPDKGLIGLFTNGGFAEYIAVPEKNAFKIPSEMQWELAASLRNHFDTISCVKTAH